MRREVSRCNGTEVTTSGDGFFARIDSPVRAPSGPARTVREAMTALDLESRAGIHTGECEMEGRLAHRHGRAHRGTNPGVPLRGEILVFPTVQDLLVGSTLRFTAAATGS